MAQTIKHRRGKLESIKDITPINGELIIASGSDLSVHQEGLLFVGVEGNVLTPANKILTGSATLDVTTSDFDHSVDGIPYYETDAKKLTILGHGGNTDVELAHGQIDFKGSGIVSSSSQVSELAGINDSTLTITAGDGLKTGGTFTSNQSGDSSVTLNIDVSDFAGTGLNADGSENINIDSSYLNTSLNAATSSYLTTVDISSNTNLAVSDTTEVNMILSGDTISAELIGGVVSGSSQVTNIANSQLAGSIAASKLAGSIGDSKLSTISTADKVSLSALDIDGGTDIGAALVDADLMIVDDGAGGTNRKATMSRLATYMQGALSFSSGDIEGVTAGSGITQGGTSGTVVVGVDSGSLAGSGLVAPAGGAINVNVDDSTIEINSDTVRIKDDGVTYAKIQNVSATNRILGRDSSGAGVIEEITPANLRTMINVADGAEVNVATNLSQTTAAAQLTIASSTGTNIVVAEASDTIAGLMSTTHHDKLDGIAAGAEVNVATNLSQTTAAAQLTIASSTGTNIVVAEASDTIAGLMSTTHHDKLDGIEASATADQTAIEIINLLNSDLGGDKQIGTQTDDKMTFGGSVTVTGDLQVNGTTTTVDSTTVNIGDNILELNYAGTAADAGILVKDAVGGANVSGSLLWDASEDYWIAGALGSEGRVIVGNGTDTAGKITKFSADGVITDSILSESGTTLTISNDVIVSGLTASQLVVTNGSKQLTSSTDISALTLTLDGGEF
tara:strand:+ start:42 stop:2243 length:2202 start_codon:yes stop_codon:yes gene_type:complete